jgi:predicted methyltransferase
MKIKSSEELESFLTSHNIYKYNYIDGSMVTRHHVEQILDAMRRGARYIETTLDLGLSRAQIEIRGESIIIDGLEISVKELERRVEEGFLYKLIGGDIVRMDMFKDSNYYKLKPVAIDKAPTIEINGMQMHRTIGKDPWSDARDKVRALGRVRGLRVLEIGTGLGYSASHLILLGASEVISIEKDLNVLQLASANPWSKMLENPRIKIVVGDAYNLVEDLCSECFEKIFHDPPRISIAEELYSSEFYRELYRILRSNGKLFHYTGEPGKHSNISYLKGIKRRLEEAGFYKVLWINDAKGFIAFKP